MSNNLFNTPLYSDQNVLKWKETQNQRNSVPQNDAHTFLHQNLQEWRYLLFFEVMSSDLICIFKNLYKGTEIPVVLSPWCVVFDAGQVEILNVVFLIFYHTL